MTRLQRKNRTDIIYKGCGGLMDAFDDVIKQAWRINDDEYDFLCSQSDEVLSALVTEHKSFSIAKNSIQIINKALESYTENWDNK